MRQKHDLLLGEGESLDLAGWSMVVLELQPEAGDGLAPD